MLISRKARMTRQAISPRLATSTFVNMAGVVRRERPFWQAWSDHMKQRAHPGNADESICGVLTGVFRLIRQAVLLQLPIEHLLVTSPTGGAIIHRRTNRGTQICIGQIRKTLPKTHQWIGSTKIANRYTHLAGHTRYLRASHAGWTLRAR